MANYHRKLSTIFLIFILSIIAYCYCLTVFMQNIPNFSLLPYKTCLILTAYHLVQWVQSAAYRGDWAQSFTCSDCYLMLKLFSIEQKIVHIYLLTIDKCQYFMIYVYLNPATFQEYLQFTTTKIILHLHSLRKEEILSTKNCYNKKKI